MKLVSKCDENKYRAITALQFQIGTKQVGLFFKRHFHETSGRY